VVFVPSYGRRQTEELRRLEVVSQEVLTSLKTEIENDESDQPLLQQLQLNQDSVIKGVAIYDQQGELIDAVGEAPKFTARSLTKTRSFSIWPLQISTDSSEVTTIRHRTEMGTRYDVAWPIQSAERTPAENRVSNQSISQRVPRALAIRHDATVVSRTMRRYALGVVGLVLIISAFVTWVTLQVLQRIVISPLLLLKRDLAAAGSAIAQGHTPDFESLKRIAPNELGEVSLAFQAMFEQIQSEIRDRTQAEINLRIEQQKADRLLLNILPATIAAQLKESEGQQRAIADRFETATILFADIVKFTEIAAGTSPTQLVCQLNDIFSAFDAIAERHNLEKIKTIGDAYMVVGGVPSPTQNHAQAVMSMAIEMMDFADNYVLGGDRRLCLRIGINTGPVVAGVIGTKKFSYDLWGDAVNIASRMESHGVVNRIQVSEETYLQLKDTYAFEDRGYSLIKGRGEMRTFLLGT